MILARSMFLSRAPSYHFALTEFSLALSDAASLAGAQCPAPAARRGPFTRSMFLSRAPSYHFALTEFSLALSDAASLAGAHYPAPAARRCPFARSHAFSSRAKLPLRARCISGSHSAQSPSLVGPQHPTPLGDWCPCDPSWTLTNLARQAATSRFRRSTRLRASRFGAAG